MQTSPDVQQATVVHFLHTLNMEKCTEVTKQNRMGPLVIYHNAFNPHSLIFKKGKHFGGPENCTLLQNRAKNKQINK